MKKCQIANFFAKYSVTKWNKCRPLRLLCRYVLHVMELWEENFSPSHKIRLKQYYGGSFSCHRHIFRHDWSEGRDYTVDTTIELYRNPRFAPWELDDSPGNYNIIGGRHGWVIRHSTYYADIKIAERTGKHLVRIGKDDPRLSQETRDYLAEHGRWDAKIWGELLELNGYHRTNDELEWSPLTGFVGIDPTDGEYGQLFLLEKVDMVLRHDQLTKRYIVSTYRKNRYCLEAVSSDDTNIVWYKIC